MIRKGMSTLAAVGGIVGVAAIGLVGFNMMSGDCGVACGTDKTVTPVAAVTTDKDGCCPLGGEATIETVAMTTAGDCADKAGTCADKASDCATACEGDAVAAKGDCATACESGVAIQTVSATTAADACATPCATECAGECDADSCDKGEACCKAEQVATNTTEPSKG